MVYLKVSDGSETRKLQVTPGELSFDQLREQLATLFPKTVNEGESDLSLQYRDADGDVITLSSDQELQLALSEIEEDGVWKVYLKNTQRGGSSGSPQRSEGTGQRSKRRSPCGGSLFQHLFEPTLKRRRLFSSVWDDLEEQLQLLHLLHDDVLSSNGRTDQSTTSKDDAQKSTSEGEGTKSETAENTSTPSTSTEERDTHIAEDPDEEVRSKPHPASPGSDEKEGEAASSEPRWETRRFVTWEPRLQVGPFGFFHSHMTPVVYKVSYKSSSGNGGCCTSSGEGKKKKESKEASSTAAGSQEEEVESQAPTTDVSGEASTQTTESATVTVQ